MRGKDKQIASIIARILRLRPDVLALQSIDYDYDHVAAGLLKDTLAAAGHPMPHHFARAPNTGVPTPFDLDRNGYLGDARDMQGYGKFTGQGGMLLLSRFRILQQDAQDFTALIWEDVPDAQMPIGYFSPSETDILRLHTVGAWDVPVDTPLGPVRVLMSHAGPPVFDGPEDRNGLRNADEIRFWASYVARMSDPFVVMADLNNDPVDGEGLKPALQALLEAPQIIDPAPSHSRGTDTVDWGFDDLRVDYVLPSADFRVVASGVDWPVSEGEDEVGPRHKPVWVDLVVK